MRRRSTQLKERLKTLKKIKKKAYDYSEQTLDDKIKELKGKILLCEYDLNGMFKNNLNIINKLNGLKNLLKEAENEKENTKNQETP